MTKTVLITMGCSWTYGSYVGYEYRMTRDELDTTQLDPDISNKLSFRGLLSKKYNLTNKNFSITSSSNQKQFRLAKEFFSSAEFNQYQRDFDKIIVLWGITSTARNELWAVESNDLVNFFYNNKLDHGKELIKYLGKFYYNHENEVALLATEMRHWNTFFQSLNIDNFWFDTFNHHDYHCPGPRIDKFKKLYNSCRGPSWPLWENFSRNEFSVDQNIFDESMDKTRWPWVELFHPLIDRLIYADKKPRDLMSILAINNGLEVPDADYTKKIKYLIDCGILNPYTKHPTKRGHKQIAEILSEFVEPVIV